MKERIIESFVDCGVHIVYSSPKEFIAWAKDRDIKVDEDLMRIAFGMNHKFFLDGEEINQYVWINSAAGRSFDKLIGTVAHEATHVVDNIELFISNNPGNSKERIPREIRARMVEKIVIEGYKLISEDLKSNENRQTCTEE